MLLRNPADSLGTASGTDLPEHRIRSSSGTVVLSATDSHIQSEKILQCRQAV